MRAKAALFFMLTLLIISVCGCETIKGAFRGGAEGASRDWESCQGTRAQIMKIDDWIRKNLW